MLPWLLLFVLPSTYSLNCSYIFDGQQYTKSNILTIDGIPKYLQIEPITNDLIFSLADSELKFTGRIYIVRNGTTVKLDINYAYVAATDFEHNRVFIGSKDGLKLLNSQNKASLTVTSVQNENIIRLFKPLVEDKLFIVTYPNKTVYQLDLNTFEKSKVTLISPAWEVVADKEGNVFYYSDSSEYKMLLKYFKDPIKFVGLDNSENNQLIIDDSNRVIAVVDDGLYWLKPDSIIPKKLMDLDFVPYSVIFDCDDIYISTLNTIYKFSRSDCR